MQDRSIGGQCHTQGGRAKLSTITRRAFIVTKAKEQINMTNIVPMVMTFLMMTQTKAQDLFGSVGRAVIKEGAAIKHPVVETVSFIGSSQCSNVKRIFGMEYDQVESSHEPDLGKLTLNYISSEISVYFNLSSAAKLIIGERGYNSAQNFTIFIHGFTDDPTKSSFEAIRNAYVASGRHVLALDGSSLIRWLYLRSTTYVRFMGEKLGDVLAAMVSSGMDPSTIHMIGHSLGSHIAGFAGKRFFDQTGKLVGRISGLDPAGPCFSHVDEGMRLKATDATFVDVIHTDAGVYGLKDPVGQVDFFPNGGGQQPNCFFQTCGHSRVWELYSESVINPEAFIGLQCGNYEQFKRGQCSGKTSLMGYACPPGTRGQFYLQTAELPPYGIGPKGIKYVNNEGIVNNIGSGVKNIFG